MAKDEKPEKQYIVIAQFHSKIHIQKTSLPASRDGGWRELFRFELDEKHRELDLHGLIAQACEDYYRKLEQKLKEKPAPENKA